MPLFDVLTSFMGAGSDKTAKRMAIHIGQAIRSRREQNELNQDELAWRSDTNRHTKCGDALLGAPGFRQSLHDDVTGTQACARWSGFAR